MPSTRPITDSPWFWAYLFGTAALVALALASHKFSLRQTQIEREYQGRQRAAQNLNGQAPSVEMSATGRTLITLRPLFIALAAITMIAWFVFWRTHMASGGRALASEGRQPPEAYRAATANEPAGKQTASL